MYEILNVAWCCGNDVVKCEVITLMNVVFKVVVTEFDVIGLKCLHGYRKMVCEGTETKFAEHDA